MNLYYENNLGKLYLGNALNIDEKLDRESVDMCITSPPYWALRKYGSDNELGQEASLYKYIDNLVSIFNHIYPVLKNTGSLWVNIGDTYYGSGKGSGGKTQKQLTNPGSYFNKGNKGAMLDNPEKFIQNELPKKSLCNIPARFSIAMQDSGWILRNVIIWHKPNNFVTSAKDRFTVDFEYLYWFTKINKDYYFKQQFEPFSNNTKWKPVREKDGSADWDKGTGQESHRARNMRPNDGRNKRTVWSINTKPVYGLKHYAKFPPKLLETPILSTCPEDGIILDPFMGSGTTAIVAEEMNRKWVGIEIVEEYCETIKERINNDRTY